MTIKIVRIIDRVNVGGPAIHVALTSRGLSAKETDGKFDTLLVHGRVAEGEEEMSHLFDSSIRREIVPSLSRKISPVSDLLAFLSIFRILLREKPQVVHTHKSKAGVLGRLAAWIFRVPVRVHTFHGQVFEGYFSPAVSRWIVRTEKFFANRADAIIAISPALREEISVKNQIAPLEKVRLVSLGLNLSPLSAPAERRRLQREKELSPQTPAVGIVGRLAPIKNHELFLQAVQKLARARGGVHFFIVGGGELEGTLKARAKELGLSDRCHFTGFRTDLPEIYASLDALALTSDNEGTPVAVIEALAAGVPVVATDVGGVRDVFSTAGTGTLVPPGNTDALADALLDLLASPPPPAAREEARQKVLAHYSEKRLCRDLAALYEELLGISGKEKATVVK